MYAWSGRFRESQSESLWVYVLALHGYVGCYILDVSNAGIDVDFKIYASSLRGCS